MARPETGTMQFGDDWRGVFIRGDDAFALAQAISEVCEKSPSIYKHTLLGLRELLLRSNVQQRDPGVQVLRDFDACRGG